MTMGHPVVVLSLGLLLVGMVHVRTVMAMLPEIQLTNDPAFVDEGRRLRKLKLPSTEEIFRRKRAAGARLNVKPNPGAPGAGATAAGAAAAHHKDDVSVADATDPNNIHISRTSATNTPVPYEEDVSSLVPSETYEPSRTTTTTSAAASSAPKRSSSSYSKKSSGKKKKKKGTKSISPSETFAPSGGQQGALPPNCQVLMWRYLRTELIQSLQQFDAANMDRARFPLYDLASGENIGFYQDSVTYFGNLTLPDDCVFVAVFSTDLNATSGLYDSQITIQGTCNGSYNSITGGTGAYDCSSGYHYFNVQDGDNNLNTRTSVFHVCQQPCSFG